MLLILQEVEIMSSSPSPSKLKFLLDENVHSPSVFSIVSLILNSPPKLEFKGKVFIWTGDEYSIMEKIPGWIERLLLPKLNEITGEIKAIHSRIDAVHTRIDGVEKEVAGLRREMMVKFDVVDSKFEAVDSRFDALEARLPVMEKMAEFEVRLAELERKVTA